MVPDWKNAAISDNFWAISEILTDLRSAFDSGSDKHLKTSVASIFPTRTIFPWDRYTIFSSSFQLLLLNFVAHCQFIIWMNKQDLKTFCLVWICFKMKQKFNLSLVYSIEIKKWQFNIGYHSLLWIRRHVDQMDIMDALIGSRKLFGGSNSGLYITHRISI